jgi:type I restriction-modification system DNA methylase subunit
LVAAFDQIKRNSAQQQTDIFKKYNLFGLDQDGVVMALAIVNMIFRGDGRNNMREGNCFAQHLVPYTITDEKLNVDVATAEFSPIASSKKVVTKVLMNPPFALKVESEQEYKFVKYALDEMDDGGILFSVLPVSTMVENEAYLWRKNLVEENTLLAVVTFPNELFYPIGQNTVGIFIRKGRIQKTKPYNVLWCRATTDGFVKKKGKRLSAKDAMNDLEDLKLYIQAFVANQNIIVKDIPQKLKTCSIDTLDEELELIPEAYIDDRTYSEEEILGEMSRLYKENLAFKVRYGEQYVSK